LHEAARRSGKSTGPYCALRRFVPSARRPQAVGVSLAPARAAVEELVGRGSSAPPRYLQLDPSAKQVLFVAARLQALRLGHNYVGDEHLLLGLLDDLDGGAVGVVTRLGADPAQIRAELTRLVAAAQETPAPPEELVSIGGDQLMLLETVAATRRLEREVQRLRQRLREHGIEPDNGTPQPV
jgi:ATP-dependent Clp protease ATP-binding subunit ClpA